jgi:hypothetical protein
MLVLIFGPHPQLRIDRNLAHCVRIFYHVLFGFAEIPGDDEREVSWGGY